MLSVSPVVESYPSRAASSTSCGVGQMPPPDRVRQKSLNRSPAHPDAAVSFNFFS
ncbi:unnamed protein product [Strongylus vulgaris]|uniref:Uncharacterized protein n=1 Tax=Strongylus vulgaris TaxID=40348 RepID=A0A3P7LUP2_STRVU|nr:unnamed protein product [Strongylus vulgaris]